jgi:hypothetical protein
METINKKENITEQEKSIVFNINISRLFQFNNALHCSTELGIYKYNKNHWELVESPIVE